MSYTCREKIEVTKSLLTNPTVLRTERQGITQVHRILCIPDTHALFNFYSARFCCTWTLTHDLKSWPTLKAMFLCMRLAKTFPLTKKLERPFWKTWERKKEQNESELVSFRSLAWKLECIKNKSPYSCNWFNKRTGHDLKARALIFSRSRNGC